MENTIVEISNLSHRYSVQWAIQNINLKIERHGIYGLLGSNGAGKSTLMNIMCGVLKPTSGDVTIKGISMREDPIAVKRLIGFLPQQAPLYMDMTVEEYLVHCARMHHVIPANIPAAVEKAMSYCDITHFRKRLIRNLSGGYQQRVGIAQAIVHDPELVVFDEPTNGLDPNQILEVRNLIKGIAQERTVILSTHILREVEAICDHIFMMEQGQLIFSGEADKFYNYLQPMSLFVSLIALPSTDDLYTIPGVTNVEDLGGMNYRLHFSDSTGIASRLVKASVQNGWRLKELRLEKSSLDTIFMALSKQKHA